jgi:hypothetical protein
MPDLNSTFLGVELQNWVTSGAIVLLVGIAHLALGWLTRRRARTNWDALAPGESAKPRYWIARGLSDAVPPIAFMLWLHGLYLAVTTLLADLPETLWVSRGYMTLGELRGVGTLLGFAWLLARIARLSRRCCNLLRRAPKRPGTMCCCRSQEWRCGSSCRCSRSFSARPRWPYPRARRK